MSEQRDAFDKLVALVKSHEAEPTVAFIQWAQNLLVEALKSQASELEGALDAGPLKCEDIKKFKADYARILDAVWVLDGLSTGKVDE